MSPSTPKTKPKIALTFWPPSVKVKYVELKGWETDITAVRSFNDLPENAQKYVKFVEDFIGIKVQYIGVGYV